jgi:hypothetical protein
MKIASFLFDLATEKAASGFRWDTPKSAHPCAGSGGDIHVATRSQRKPEAAFSFNLQLILSNCATYR